MTEVSRGLLERIETDHRRFVICSFRTPTRSPVYDGLVCSVIIAPTPPSTPPRVCHSNSRNVGQCLLVALSGHPNVLSQCPLSGVKQTWCGLRASGKTVQR